MIISYLETIKTHQKIDQKLFNYLFPPPNPRTSIFYILPKIHKTGIPGRPIVSSVGSLTENISKFLDLCTSPIVPKIKSHIKDTTHLLKTVLTGKKLPKNTLLVSLDITSLYTNIPHQEGIDACLYYIDKYRDTIPSFIPNDTILRTLFSFVLENNYFEFNDTLYKQIHGTAMGSSLAPNYANLFLGYLEENNILNTHYQKFIKFYLRFLDDILILWKGSRPTLTAFLKYINKIHPRIKFTYTSSETEIDFLDTTLYIHPTKDILQSKPYSKPTDTKTLLQFESYHPIHTKKSIIYSQALRYRRITSENKILKKELKSLTEVFTQRGYPIHIINGEIKKLSDISQHQLLFGKIKKNRIAKKPQKLSSRLKSKLPKPRRLKPSRTLPLIIPYSEHFNNFQNLMEKHWKFITKDKCLRRLFPDQPFISYKRHKNLKDYLIRTKFQD